MPNSRKATSPTSIASTRRKRQVIVAQIAAAIEAEIVEATAVDAVAVLVAEAVDVVAVVAAGTVEVMVDTVVTVVATAAVVDVGKNHSPHRRRDTENILKGPREIAAFFLSVSSNPADLPGGTCVRSHSEAI